jgi:carbon-monoxide dehydrogenase medium subunit
VDLGGIKDLVGIKADGSGVTIGAMTTHGAVAASKEVKSAIPALAHLAGEIGDPQVRHRGTIGGSIANNDPAADYPAGCVALGATIVTSKREIAADDFFKGLYETALSPGELITAVSFPVPEKAAYVKFKQPASRFAVVGVLVAKTGGGVRVAVTGAKATVFRVKALEDALAKNFSPAACDGISVPATGMNNDIHGSAEYRASLIPVLAKRAVASL